MSPLDSRSLAKFREQLLTWFDEHRRDLPWRSTNDPYRIWVSEVMLQQTQVATVIPFFNRFVARYPDILTLANADGDAVLKSWEGLGYYARARNLHRAAKEVVNDLDGLIPSNYDDFRKLPGVGEYVAAAVMSIAHNAPYPAVDGNVKRVLSRLRCIDSPANKSTSAKIWRENAALFFDDKHPASYNEAIMELGATVCRPTNPQCDVCPVNEFCEAFNTSTQSDYPVKAKRSPVPTHHIAIGVVHKDDRILITQRKRSGLLGGLWEFPGGKVENGEKPEDACRREIQEEVNLAVKVTDYLTHVDHAYSHFKIAVDVFSCSYQAGNVELKGPIDYRWILVDEIDQYAFPGANHKFIPLLKQEKKRT